MTKPSEIDENNGAYIYSSLTEGSTFGTLNTSAKETAKAAARVVETLAKKTRVLPGAFDAPAAAYYDKSSPHGALLASAILNTVARMGDRDFSREPNYIEKSIHGEILVMSEARHVLSVAEGRADPLESSSYAVNARIVRNHPEVKTAVQLQASGQHYQLNSSDEIALEKDIMHNYASPEDETKWGEMKEDEGKFNYHLAGGQPANDIEILEANSTANMSRVHNLLIYNQSIGNADIGDAIRSVHNQMSAPGSAFRRANPEMSESDFQLVQHQEMKAGARLLALVETGMEFTPRQAAASMLNDMAIMHACSTEQGPGLLMMSRIDAADKQNLIMGDYGQLSDKTKIAVHSRLAQQHYVAPGLYQGACQYIAEHETQAGPMTKRIRSQMAIAAAQSQIDR